jgi:mannose-1-phosphate guanylyltransferase
MLARVPSIPSLDVEQDSPHPRVWAIVLTGDAAPVADRAHRAAGRVRRWRSGCAGAQPAAPAIDVARLVPASRVVTVTTRGRTPAWASALPTLPHVHRLVQPHYRGRAAETLLPLLRIARQDPGATVVIVPADHGVRHEARFHRYVARAVWAVALRPDLPILIGAHPHTPLTSGWIEPGAPVEGLEDLSVHVVKRMVDTASLAEQRRLFESGALVSTLVFVGRAGTLLSLAAEALPEVLEALEPLAEAFGTPEESLLREAVYECMPEDDLSALERAPGLAVLPLPDVVWQAPEREALELGLAS